MRSVVDYGKVAVLIGGWSAEREVSLLSGAAVLDALKSVNVDAHGIDVDRDIGRVLSQGGYDRVFNILHGRSGEDGEIQGMLEIMGMPYTGSGVAASAVAMDKLVCKTIWRAEGLPTPDYLIMKNAEELRQLKATLGYPFVIKPATEGSSVGIHLVRSEDAVKAAWQDAAQYGVVIGEQFIKGSEYTVSILDGEALPVIRIETPHQFYDYSAKYQSDKTLYHIPCGLNAEAEVLMQQQALAAFDALACRTWGRIDFMRDESGNNWLIDANTQPGMTSHSLVPKAAEAAGISFTQLVLRILDSSMDPSVGVVL